MLKLSKHTLLYALLLVFFVIFIFLPANANPPKDTEHTNNATHPSRQLEGASASSSELPSTIVTPVTLSQILYQIDTYYVEDTNSNALLHAAIQHIFSQLDPYSSFLDEKELRRLLDITEGKYNGLGIEVEKRGEHMIIMSSLANSPAEIAGLQKGDIILSVNGETTEGKEISDIARILQIHKDQTINMLVARDAYPHPLSFDVTQADLEVQSVQSELRDNDIGYIKLYSFQNHTTVELAKHIQELLLNNENYLAGLVLDLRDNPGGVLESAIGVADLFLNAGTIVSTKGRFSQANNLYYATPGDILSGINMVVLINNGSASAAEIVAGALQAHKRAILLGEKSYGKGSVQSLIPINQGKSAIKLTTALYLTPNGQSIDGVGINPDKVIQQKIAHDVLNQLDNSSSGLPSGKQLAEFDAQLIEAEKELSNANVNKRNLSKHSTLNNH
ncbi:S41 family peptidase [Flocculibacter collagenilyticus]|uniref:S41 family peptidase n=1 Tax=Flocculibacter collagenilyticus TaxID=2744479 RepID=UPI0018F2A80A|nr:S41 family peptidase [Flocculibacter collagenilyticus]